MGSNRELPARLTIPLLSPYLARRRREGLVVTSVTTVGSATDLAVADNPLRTPGTDVSTVHRRKNKDIVLAH